MGTFLLIAGILHGVVLTATLLAWWRERKWVQAHLDALGTGSIRKGVEATR